MENTSSYLGYQYVALFTRAWIEIFASIAEYNAAVVALFTRAWIEIHDYKRYSAYN